MSVNSPEEASSSGDKNNNEDSDPPIENDNPGYSLRHHDEENVVIVSPCGEKNVSTSAFVAAAKSSKDQEDPRAAAERYRDKLRHSGARRRRKSSGSTVDANYVPPYKRFRKQSSSTMVLPSKFLLGGNIHDPLNLASLVDANKSKKRGGGGETPLTVPKNWEDPLGLQAEDSRTPNELTAEEIATTTRTGRNKRHHHRRRKRTDSETTNGSDEEIPLPGGQGSVPKTVHSSSALATKDSVDDSQKLIGSTTKLDHSSFPQQVGDKAERDCISKSPTRSEITDSKTTVESKTAAPGKNSERQNPSIVYPFMSFKTYCGFCVFRGKTKGPNTGH